MRSQIDQGNSGSIFRVIPIARSVPASRAGERSLLFELIPLPLGIVGRLVLFVWSLSMVIFAQERRLPVIAALCLLFGLLVYPRALHKTIRGRNFVLLGMMTLPLLFYWNDVDRSFFGIGYTSQGMEIALQIALRFVIMMVAVQGFVDTVEISAIAALFERFGLKGLGFSLGVAMNMIPALQESSLDAWQSLRMRGGLRKKRWRGLQLLLTTIMANALRRAEEISLAAEARAFSLEKSRSVPIALNIFDLCFISGALLSVLFLVV